MVIDDGNGMNEDEKFALVETMLHSGEILDFSNSKCYVADKHSTGGIGDKVSLILAPIMAAAGIKIPMIAVANIESMRANQNGKLTSTKKL